MPGLSYIIDPDDAPLALSTANGFDVIGPVRFRPARKEKLWASNIDSEGERAAGSKTSNAETTLPLRLTGGSEALFQQRQVALDEKYHKLEKEGGVLRVVQPNGSYADWEIRDVAGGEKLFDNRYLHSWRTEDEITFVTAPFGESQEEVLGTFTTAAGREALGAVVSVGGSAEALVRAIVKDKAARDRWWLRWGRESRNYSSAATADYEYAATALTPLSPATVTEGVVRHSSLGESWQPIVSTEVAGVGHMTHLGVFEVYAIVKPNQFNLGETHIALEWGPGDLSRGMVNASFVFEQKSALLNKEVLISLGEVRIEPPANGVPRWQGRIIAKSTPSALGGDVLDVRKLILMPVAEGNAELSVPQNFAPSPVLLARDGFDAPAGGLLAGNVAPLGGTWSGAGDADDFLLEGSFSKTRRYAVSDAVPRYGVLGTTEYTNIGVRLFVESSNPEADNTTRRLGALLRYIDTNNWLAVVFRAYSLSVARSDWGVELIKKVAGVETVLGGTTVLQPVARSVWWLPVNGTIEAMAFDTGVWLVGANGQLIAAGTDTALATAGALAKGKVGLYDFYSAALGHTRTYDSFSAWKPGLNAVLFASRQLELRHDGAERQNATGTDWAEITPSGDLLRLAPEGAEARENRLVLLPSAYNPGEMPHVGGDLEVELRAKRRYRTISDPA